MSLEDGVGGRGQTQHCKPSADLDRAYYRITPLLEAELPIFLFVGIQSCKAVPVRSCHVCCSCRLEGTAMIATRGQPQFQLRRDRSYKYMDPSFKHIR